MPYYPCQALGTASVITFLGLYIYIHSDLLRMDKSAFNSKDHILLLVTLLPSLLVLVGSYYKIDFFFADTDDKPKKSQKELLADILESNNLILKALKQTHSGGEASNDQSTKDNRRGQSTSDDQGARQGQCTEDDQGAGQGQHTEIDQNPGQGQSIEPDQSAGRCQSTEDDKRAGDVLRAPGDSGRAKRDPNKTSIV